MISIGFWHRLLMYSHKNRILFGFNFKFQIFIRFLRLHRFSRLPLKNRLLHRSKNRGPYFIGYVFFAFIDYTTPTDILDFTSFLFTSTPLLLPCLVRTFQYLVGDWILMTNVFFFFVMASGGLYSSI